MKLKHDIAVGLIKSLIYADTSAPVAYVKTDVKLVNNKLEKNTYYPVVSTRQALASNLLVISTKENISHIICLHNCCHLDGQSWDINFVVSIYTIFKQTCTPIPKSNMQFEHISLKNADGTPLRARQTGKVKLWKTRKNDFKIPVKYGLKDSFYITQDNAHEWLIVE